jgi:mycoredoxin
MSKIVIYGAEWCGDCRRSKRFLDRNNVAYEYINIEEDAAATEKVIEINGGMKSIPVIIFEDGTHMTEPSDIDLQAKLEALKVL